MNDGTDILAILANLAPGELEGLNFPYEQEQSLAEQRMALGAGLRRPGPERSSPLGAALGGLGNVVGGYGGAELQRRGLQAQEALGKRMQKDATGRIGSVLKAREAEKMKMLEELLRGGALTAPPMPGGG